MPEFVSESIAPIRGNFDASAMARGEPGLPAGFTWRDAEYRVVALRGKWKESSPEGGKVGNEVYLRRHYFDLKMDDSRNWTVYFTRQTSASGSVTNRWFLYTIE